MTETPKTQARLAAELVLNTYFISYCVKMARRAIETRTAFTLYPPNDSDYATAAALLEPAMTPPESELSVAVPADMARSEP